MLLHANVCLDFNRAAYLAVSCFSSMLLLSPSAVRLSPLALANKHVFIIQRFCVRVFAAAQFSSDRSSWVYLYGKLYYYRLYYAHSYTHMNFVRQNTCKNEMNRRASTR